MVAERYQDAPKIWTYSELQARDKERGEERREEVYDGELCIMSSPKLRHQKILLALAMLLELYAREHAAGQVYIAPVDLYISETSFFEPDLMFVAQARLDSERIEREDGACLVAPPDLIIEIVSDSTGRNDRVKKFNAYESFGVRHYWLVDPDEKTLLAFELREGRYTREAALTDEDTFAPALFPGLQIPLAPLFA